MITNFKESSHKMSKDFYALPGKFSVSKKFMSEPISNPFVNGNNKVTVRGWCGSRSPKRKKRNSSNHPPAIDLVKFSKNEFFEKHKCLMMTIAKMSMRSIQKKFIFLNPEVYIPALNCHVFPVYFVTLFRKPLYCLALTA